MKLTLFPEDNHRLNTLCGPNNSHLEQIEKSMDVAIISRGNEFFITGTKKQIIETKILLLNK